MFPNNPNLVAVMKINAMMKPYMASCTTRPGPPFLTRNLTGLNAIMSVENSKGILGRRSGIGFSIRCP
jgi:hypothetical protein